MTMTNSVPPSIYCYRLAANTDLERFLLVQGAEQLVTAIFAPLLRLHLQVLVGLRIEDFAWEAHLEEDGSISYDLTPKDVEPLLRDGLLVVGVQTWDLRGYGPPLLVTGVCADCQEVATLVTDRTRGRMICQACADHHGGML